MTNLASEENAKKINQRFKELEQTIRDQADRMTMLEGTVGNMQNLINKQTDMIQKLWVNNNGTGATEK